MRWINVKRKELVGLECINPKNDRHILRLSPNSKNMIQDEQDTNDTRIVSIIVNNKPSIDDIKKHLLSLQEEYDNSAEVNSFYLNGKRVWLDKATRVGLVNALNIEKSAGKTDTVLWLNNISININIDKALQLLSIIEMYAKECYNNTHKHYSDITKLETLEDCLSFDITSDYPDILKIKTE